MQSCLRFFAGLALAMALPLWLSAEAPLSSSAAEVQLQFGDLLSGESRFEEAIAAYERAKTSEQPVQQYRALVGIIKSSLRVADFSRALLEAQGLRAVAPQSPEAIGLYADALSLDGDLPRGRQVRIESLPPRPIWNAPLLAGLFVLLIGGEWLLRKRVGLL